MCLISSPMHKSMPNHYKRRPSLTDPFIVDCVLQQDVLCGRDGNSTKHPGNKRFRAIIQSYCERYQRSHKRSEKTALTLEVVSVVQEEGGRFLRFDDKLGCWVQVAHAHVHDKVSHALRSAKIPPKRSLSSGDSSGKASETKTCEEIEEEAFQVVSEAQNRIYKYLLDNFCHKGAAGDGGPSCCNPNE